MSLLKRQKRASSTHHGHQRDKTKWNPTAARRHPSSRLSSLLFLFSSPLLSPPLPRSFIHSPFLASTSCHRCRRHFFFLPLFFPPLCLFSLTVFGATPHPFQPSPLSAFSRVFFSSLSGLFSTSSLLPLFFRFFPSLFFLFSFFFFASLSVSIQSARLRILSKEQAGRKHGDKERERERRGERNVEEGTQTLYTRPKWTVGAQSQPTLSFPLAISGSSRGVKRNF